MPITFTATSGHYLSLDSITFPNNEFSVSCWCNCVGTSSDGWRCISSKQELSGNKEMWTFAYRTGNYNFYIMSTDDSQNFILASATYNSWRHLVATAKGGAGGSMNIYENGNLVATASYEKTIKTNSNPILIGANENNAPPPEDYYNGALHDHRIYNRALTATEVKCMYHSFGKDFIRNGLISAVSMSEMTSGTVGTILDDMTKAAVTEYNDPVYSVGILRVK